MPILDGLELSWFDAGSGIFDRIIDDPGCFPPLNDRAVQREWLAGFVGAWGELLVCSDSLTPDPRGGPVKEVLARALNDRPELLRELLAITETPAQGDPPYG
jgi:hypothetical protein